MSVVFPAVFLYTYIFKKNIFNLKNIKLIFYNILIFLCVDIKNKKLF